MNRPDNENVLIDRARHGERAAFERLAERQCARLQRCALALGRDPHWAEDLVQETLLEAWRSLARFDGQHPFSAWLYGILRHRYLKGLRQRHAATTAVPQVLEGLPGPAAAPDRSAECAEDALRVRAAVASLPDEHRLVVELRFFAGAALDEIAAALDCPLGTVKSRLHYALEKIRQMSLVVNRFAAAGEERESKS